MQESSRADRAWQDAMAHDARPENEGADDLASRRLLDGLWVARERAREGLADVQREMREQVHRRGVRRWFRPLDDLPPQHDRP